MFLLRRAHSNTILFCFCFFLSLTFYKSSYRLSENLADESDAFSTLEEVKTAYLVSEEQQGKKNCSSEEQIG